MSYEPRPGGSPERLLLAPFGVEYSLARELTEPGRINEDVTLVDDTAMVYAVFDGAGAHAEPYRAAITMAKNVRVNFYEVPRMVSLDEAVASTRNALLVGHDALTAYSAHTYADLAEWPRATGVVLRLFETPEGRKRGIVAHCGDSRLYRLRRIWSERARAEVVDIKQLTLDHSPGNTWEDQRLFARIASRKGMKQLTSQQLRLFADNYTITEAFGSPGLDPDIRIGRLSVRDGDVFLLTTDGIHDNVPDQEMEEIFATYDRIDKGLEALANRAQDLSRLGKKVYPRSKRDDMSGVAVAVRLAVA